MAPTPLSFHSISGQHRHLTPLRQISSNIRLVHDQSQPHIPLILKTIVATSQSDLDLLLRDAASWRRVCSANPANILNLHDVSVIRDDLTVLFLMEYCPTIVTTRPERPALRILAGMAAGLAAVLAHSEQPAHANLSLSHIYLDEHARPKLAGWGLTRANRLSRRKLSQRDDVKALAGIFYQILYGARYDPSQPSLPSEPPLSPATARLLRDSLFVPVKDVPELTVFRYDIAAARSLVPICTSALAPIVKSRRGDLLIQDLNSVRGSPYPPEHNSLPAQIAPAVIPPTAVAKYVPPPQNGLHHVDKPPVANQVVVSTAILQTQPSNIQLEALVRRITALDLEPFQIQDMEHVIDACTNSEEATAEVFRVLFRCPISKNPVVAYKAITLIHHLVSDGPAKVTALAITHDEFLKWIESSWSRSRLQNRTGKIHMYSYCFAVGEIEWYVSAVRKRMETQARFAKVFSTHWLARVDGLPSLANNHRPAYAFVLEIVEKVSTLLRKIMASTDPAVIVKRSAVPMLVREVAKTYQVTCWLYATADPSEKPILEPELDVAHNATRLALAAVKADPEIASRCPPSSLLQLDEDPPRDFDVAALTSALKKKVKKKKKIIVTEDKSSDVLNGRDEAENASGDEDHDNDNFTASANGGRRKSKDEPEVRASEKPSKQHRKKSKDEVVPRTNPDSRQDVEDVSPERNPGRSATKAEHHMNGKYGVSTPGLGTTGRLERNGRGEETDISAKDRARIAYRNRRNKSNSRSISPPQGQKVHPASRIRNGRPEEDPDVNDSSSVVAAKQYETSPTTGITSRVKGWRKARKPRKPVEYDSDEEERLEGKSKKKMTKKKMKSKSKSDDESESGSDSDSAEEEQESPIRLRQSKKTRPDEKKLPSDNKPSKAKGSKRSKSDLGGGRKNGEVEGSQKALDAAASGRKTPKMDPKFEVGPNEVQFGPQIGSGGFGVVFKAKFRTETVAVKKIHAHALSNASSVAEFQSEVAVLCTLQHPNILRFMGACTKPPRLMIITEFMARGTLFDVLHQSQMQVSWPMRKKFALDTCHGMRYLHASRLLHRDLKSSNLMLDKDFNCKVGDFGLTRISGGAAAVQMTGQCGTFQYMAVEVLANKPYSDKADVFSFGILLWEMVARKLPYFGMQPMQVGIAVLQGLRPTIPSKCPLPLAKLMRSCWDNNPDKRPSFVQLVKALESMPE